MASTLGVFPTNLYTNDTQLTWLNSLLSTPAFSVGTPFIVHVPSCPKRPPYLVTSSLFLLMLKYGALSL
jgi:hypothetical protein